VQIAPLIIGCVITVLGVLGLIFRTSYLAFVNRHRGGFWKPLKMSSIVSNAVVAIVVGIVLAIYFGFIWR
jgi:uncharacterized membrane protein